MRAAGQQDVRRPFDVGLVPFGLPSNHRHHFSFRIKWDLVNKLTGGFQQVFRYSSFCRNHEQCTLGWVTNNAPFAVVFAQRGAVAQY